ncbi:MAG: hypothetical protein GWN67_28385 [Phycisphaerae bacterium]|nr:hypothetical protein [Phycisphaerae bacterium]NIR65048.1 hypothetical protein [candidate division Zixibacteria bacterium]NIP56230.1 hypothetical protein [Phycisphaerae bacterium]NIS54684.1 hypothetical protein [Phycisphaerae bacterium]NIU12275.1 hypothetical protein [Phycisphaerae bacterium]
MVKRIISKVVIAIVLLVILTISVVLYMVHRRTPHFISPLVMLSPSGQELGIIVGSLWRKGASPSADPIESQAYVIKLEDGLVQAKSISGTEAVLAMAWRPGISPPELFAAASPPGKPNHLFAVSVSDAVSTKFSRILPSGLIVGSMIWDPSGNTLAARVLDDKGFHLAISYDEGKTFSITDIACSDGRRVWTDNRTLYVQDGNDILEIDVGDGKIREKGTFASGEDIFLVGNLDGRVVYTLGDEIYCDDKLLYTTSRKVKQILADGSYLAFKEDGHVITLDDRGNVIHKKNIDDDTFLVALSSAQKYVFLLKNFKTIERYSFVDSNKVLTVYQVK